ncbi:MAG TPA: SoxR reducing system RseC family protein [Rectinemataceae bacterium]
MAIVKDIEGEVVVVSIEMHEGCESCMNGACKAGRSALKATNPSAYDLKPGDEVEIEVRTSEQAKGAFWVLGLPLAALFAGYGLGWAIFPRTSEAPAVASAGALFLVFLVIGTLVQKRRKLDALPLIIRKFDHASMS